MRRRVVLESLFGEGAKIEPHPHYPGALSVVWDWKIVRAGAPLVSVIVPTKGGGWMLQPCLGTLLQLTAYPRFEVIVVHTGDTESPDMGEWASDPRVRWYRHEGPFNWSAINNRAVREHAHGDLLCLLNDDVRICAPEWLDAMVAQALRRDVGAVGARLVYPHGLVQHVGVAVHRGVNGHIHKGLPVGQPGMHGIAVLTHENTAVTGACMVLSRTVFDHMDWFDERYAHNYNDVDFCLRLRKVGLKCVVECSAELLHLEGSTRLSPISKEGLAHWRREADLIGPSQKADDPYWNRNLMLAAQAGGLFVQGLGGEILSWDEERPDPSIPRVLLVNDLPGPAGMAVAVQSQPLRSTGSNGAVAMAADLSGFTLRMTGPVLCSSPGWDVRDPATVSDALHKLGVSRIVLRSLVGVGGPAAPIEALRCLAEIGIPVECCLLDMQAVCPRRDMTVPAKPDPQPCGEGWKNGIAYCQSCINKHGSPFGRVDVAAWWTAWSPLLAAPDEAETECFEAVEAAK